MCVCVCVCVCVCMLFLCPCKTGFLTGMSVYVCAYVCSLLCVHRPVPAVLRVHALYTLVNSLTGAHLCTDTRTHTHYPCAHV